MREIRTALIVAIIATLFLALFGALANAAPVVHIIGQNCHGNGTCTRNHTTGTIIGRDRKTGKIAILTCGHGYDPNAKIFVQIHPGKPYLDATLKSIDQADDLQLLLVDYKDRVQIYPIAATPPQTGEVVEVGGWALGKELKPRKTKVKRIHDTVFEVAETFSQGESGGPATLDGELVGVIGGNDLPTFANGRAPLAVASDGRLTCLRRIRIFVKDALGTIPEATHSINDDGTVNSQKPPAAVTPDPVPAPSPSDANPPAPAIPVEPPAPAPPALDVDKLQSSIVNGVKAELPKILTDHLRPVEQRLQSGIAQHGIALQALPADLKNAILPELPAVGKTVAADLLPAVANAAPGLLPIAGAVGGPVTLGIILAGFLLRGPLKKLGTAAAGAQPSSGFPALPDLSALAANLGNQIASHAHTALAGKLAQLTNSGSGPAGASQADATQVPAPPGETVNTSVAQVVTEIGTQAYQRMKGDLIKKNPALANDGTIKLMDSLFTQHLSGLQPKQAAV